MMVRPDDAIQVPTRDGDVLLMGHTILQTVDRLVKADEIVNPNGYGLYRETLWMLLALCFPGEDNEPKRWAMYFWLEQEFLVKYHSNGSSRFYVPREGKEWHPFDDRFMDAKQAVLDALERESGQSVTALVKAARENNRYLQRVIDQLVVDGDIEAEKIAKKHRTYTVYSLVQDDS